MMDPSRYYYRQSLKDAKRTTSILSVGTLRNKLASRHNVFKLQLTANQIRTHFSPELQQITIQSVLGEPEDALRIVVDKVISTTKAIITFHAGSSYSVISTYRCQDLMRSKDSDLFEMASLSISMCIATFLAMPLSYNHSSVIIFYKNSEIQFHDRTGKTHIVFMMKIRLTV